MGGNLIEDELYTICSNFKHDIHNFIETGTYKGETSRLASKIFKQVYTIEIVPTLYQGNQFQDSRRVTASIMEYIVKNKRATTG